MSYRLMWQRVWNVPAQPHSRYIDIFFGHTVPYRGLSRMFVHAIVTTTTLAFVCLGSKMMSQPTLDTE